MNVAHIEDQCRIYGPGNRWVIWLQGCSIRCPGCWNREMWSFRKRHEYPVERLLHRILNCKDQVEGITVLGGEPFDQYDELLVLVQKIQRNSLSVMLFTGYEIHELANSNKTEILAFTDILVSGRYEQRRRNPFLQWRGSENQRIHFLSDRYTPTILENKNYTEIIMAEDGSMTVLGFPSVELRRYFSEISCGAT